MANPTGVIGHAPEPAMAIEEAVLNAMIAAETMTLVKPTGYAFEAIDHGRLMEIMKQYNRL